MPGALSKAPPVPLTKSDGSGTDSRKAWFSGGAREIGGALAGGRIAMAEAKVISHSKRGLRLSIPEGDPLREGAGPETR